MYKVMLVFENNGLLDEIMNMRIWGDVSGFEITKTECDGNNAYSEMKKQKFDLVIVDVNIKGLDVLQLLRMTKAESLCEHIVLCSELPNFYYARQAIVLGAFDYLVKPFDLGLFYSMFSRIKNEVYANGASEVLYSEELLTYFENRDSGIFQYIDDILTKIYSSNSVVEADRTVQRILEAVVNELFEKNEWLDLYITQENLYLPNAVAEGDSNRTYCRNKLYNLFEEYSDLFPNIHNDKMKDIIMYILLNPESDLKQKSIADSLYINSSYLSTVFSAHTDIRFVDYLTTVKMKRAGWLLQNTQLKITEIALRLYYKDMGYFARLFKKQYGLSPSEYRIADNYIFEI